MAQRNLHQTPRAIGRHVAAPRSDVVVDAQAFVVGQPGHALGVEDVVEKIAVGLRNQARRIVRRALGVLVIGGRNDDVDAVGSAAHMVIDPAQFGFELFGADSRSAENTEATGLRDLDDHIAAMREREDRQLATQSFTDRRAH